MECLVTARAQARSFAGWRRRLHEEDVVPPIDGAQQATHDPVAVRALIGYNAQVANFGDRPPDFRHRPTYSIVQMLVSFIRFELFRLVLRSNNPFQLLTI